MHKIYKALNLLTLEPTLYSKSGSTFPKVRLSEPVIASSDCCLLRNTLCLCLPVQSA